MHYNINFRYSNIQQLKTIYKELLKNKGLTMLEASEKLGFSTPQQLTNKFNKKSISLDELKKMLAVVDCDFEITIKEKS